ncbi:N-acetyltransferase family protein [Bradyrhizobium sp. HKCCYLS1011]|uniref:GNAT family N-acetyltransferase n=1 Tax=Bradyrhizobium sp. HKCCYLS1011 TaxID=3420733 RepID=UPI003EBA6AB9
METSASSHPQPTTALTIRPMEERDVPELLRLMHGIVSFERGQDFNLTEAELVRRGFGERPEFGAYVADAGGNALAGMAVHYEIPFMHTLRPLLMMKWLYVDPQWRGRRVGQELVRQMARHARATGHERFYWFVLNDNAAAQSFYRGVGAMEDPEWRRWIMPAESVCRLTEEME